MLRIATDIGGTFTDLVGLDEKTGAVRMAKVPSTPPDFERGVADAIRALEPETEAGFFVHGTTVVINALTERKGARTALVTTRGFRDVLEIGRANRPDLYNMAYEKPRPFVRRRWRMEVGGRVDARGQVVEPLDEAEVRAVAEACRADGVEAIAVSLVNAYANPELEQACARLLRQLLPGVPVTAATDISRQWREYERSNTAALNAFIQPVVASYVHRLEGLLDERRIASGSRYLMQSGGGTMNFAETERSPIHLVESGPVAGVIGAAYLARVAGLERVVALDIGGTTAKASLVEHGQPRVIDEYAIERRPDWAGYPLQVPTVDIVEVGAGGGSVAWSDSAEALHVGPESAGADPGPVCYGKGGRRPTVTDANIVAGRIDGDRFLGGRMRLFRREAEEALTELGKPYGLDAAAAARGILRLAHARMGHAIEMVSLRRGYDPRDFTLVAYGGGGPVHGAALARELRLKGVLVPRHPGVFSAWGMLAADLRRGYSRTLPGRWQPDAPTDGEGRDARVRWAEAFAALEGEALRWLSGQGIRSGDAYLEHALDMRYAGQEHTVRVPLPTTPANDGLIVDGVLLSAAAGAFQDLHERTYTFRLDAPVEVVHLHVTAVGRLAPPPLERFRGGDSRPRPSSSRVVDWDENGLVETPVYERSALPAGWQGRGPVVIEEDASTTLVPPGHRVDVDDYGHIRIEGMPS